MKPQPWARRTNGTPSSDAPAPGPLTITADVFAGIRATIGSMPPEQGGALGGRYDGDITEFVFDETARRSGATYSPNHKFLNNLFEQEWNPRGIRFRGFVHSHPGGFRGPSGGDLDYCRRILRAIPELEVLYLPIIMSDAGGAFELLPFAITRDPSGEPVVHEVALNVVDAVPARVAVAADGPFGRVAAAYDLDRMRRTRLVVVGAGGSAAWMEDLARAGLGELVVIDGDRVSATNVGTQYYSRPDVDRYKVFALARRLRDINPDLDVRAVPLMLDDAVDDETFQHVALQPFAGRSAPEVIVLAGMTDNFAAQARVNRLALNSGNPSIAAQVYHEGRGAEITFTLPGVTPACHRCAQRSRYEAYLDKGFKGGAGSAGTPIFASTYLNGFKGLVTLALIHHGTDHPRWGGMAARFGKRNLVLLRLDPDISLSIGLTIFDRVFGSADHERLLFGDAVWLPQDADHPDSNGFSACPDCGGHGDLKRAIGTFADTRPMRR